MGLPELWIGPGSLAIMSPNWTWSAFLVDGLILAIISEAISLPARYPTLGSVS
jgi:hypothetical protein